MGQVRQKIFYTAYNFSILPSTYQNLLKWKFDEVLTETKMHSFFRDGVYISLFDTQTERQRERQIILYNTNIEIKTQGQTTQ